MTEQAEAAESSFTKCKPAKQKLHICFQKNWKIVFLSKFYAKSSLHQISKFGERHS